MFKERIKETGIWLLGNLVLPVGSICLLAALFGFFPILFNIVGWTAITLFGIALLFGLYVFINWLFVEPFQEYKKNKKEKTS